MAKTQGSKCLAFNNRIQKALIQVVVHASHWHDVLNYVKVAHCCVNISIKIGRCHFEKVTCKLIFKQQNRQLFYTVNLICLSILEEAPRIKIHISEF